MPERYLRQSVLAHLGLEARAVEDPGDAGLVLCERPHLGKVGLRGDPGDKAFLDAVEKELGFALPLRPNTVSASDDVTAFWLGLAVTGVLAWYWALLCWFVSGPIYVGVRKLLARDGRPSA